MESQCTKIDLLFTSSSPVKEKKGLQILSDQIKLYFLFTLFFKLYLFIFYFIYFLNCIYFFFIFFLFILFY